jgi:hypothetical protein
MVMHHRAAEQPTCENHAKQKLTAVSTSWQLACVSLQICFWSFSAGLMPKNAAVLVLSGREGLDPVAVLVTVPWLQVAEHL